MTSMKVTTRLDNLKNFQKKIQVSNLSEKTASEFQRLLRREVRNRTSPAASGNLSKNIYAKKSGRYGYGVWAPYYVWYANYGRRPGNEPGETNPKIVEWARRAGVTPKYLSKSIGDFGTKKKLFYESAKARFKTKRLQIYKDELKKLRKR